MKTIQEAYSSIYENTQSSITDWAQLLKPEVMAHELRSEVIPDEDSNHTIDRAYSFMLDKGVPSCFVEAAVQDHWWTSTFLNSIKKSTQ